MISYLRASADDAKSLVEVQLRAFSIDVNICGEGPPGYDSIDRQIELLKSHIYYKVVAEDKLIGGFYIRPQKNGHYEIIRLFIDPPYQGKGIGCMALKYIEGLFGDLKILELEATDFRKDNHAFYEKRGYAKVGEKEYSEGSFSFIYQKKF